MDCDFRFGCDEYLELKEENERLLRDWEISEEVFKRRITELTQDNERLREQVSLQQEMFGSATTDAERYRWACNHGLTLEERGDTVYIVMEYEVGPASLVESTLNDIIDSMKGSDAE